jgi:hypothetical protein
VGFRQFLFLPCFFRSSIGGVAAKIRKPSFEIVTSFQDAVPACIKVGSAGNLPSIQLF